MSIELFYLACTAFLTSLLWIPYVMDRLTQWGLIETMGYPDNPPPLSLWAQRATKAHTNAVENLVVFAALVLAVEISGLNNEVTAMAAVTFLWARIFHYVVYLAAFPWLRTITFMVGWACQLTLAWVLLFSGW